MKHVVRYTSALLGWWMNAQNLRSRWLSIVTLAIAVVLGVLSGRWLLFITLKPGDYFQFIVANGCIEFSWLDAGYFHSASVIRIIDATWWSWTWSFSAHTDATAWSSSRVCTLKLPLWIFTALLILWIAPAVVMPLRRRLRARRGLCPACAYDLRGSASQNCPECGKAVTP